MSCSQNDKAIEFKDFNKLVYESIVYAIDNDCFNFLAHEKVNTTKAFGLVLLPKDTVFYGSVIEFENFDIEDFISKSANINFSSDTLKPYDNLIHKVYPTFYESLNDFAKYHEKFKSYQLSKTRYDFIKTIIVRNPRIEYGILTNTILIELDRFFEYVIDRQFILLKTDKLFNIKTIECIDQKNEIIPQPPDYLPNKN